MERQLGKSCRLGFASFQKTRNCSRMRKSLKEEHDEMGVDTATRTNVVGRTKCGLKGRVKRSCRIRRLCSDYGRKEQPLQQQTWLKGDMCYLRRIPQSTWDKFDRIGFTRRRQMDSHASSRRSESSETLQQKGLYNLKASNFAREMNSSLEGCRVRHVG